MAKVSKGSTAIDPDGTGANNKWTADYEVLPSESLSLLRSLESYIRKAKVLQGENMEFKAFIWHQGESDRNTDAVASRYKSNLRNVIAYIRGVVGNPRLHFICGNISLKRPDTKNVSVINKAFDELAQEDKYFHVIDMRNAELLDAYHFNASWSIYLGQKVYDTMIDCGVLNGTKVNPSEP